MRGFFVCLCLAGWLPNPLQAQSKETVKGLLHKIDVKSGTISIRPTKGGVKEEVTFSLLKPDLEVATVQGRARLGDLAAGNIVQLQLNDVKDVDTIRAELPVLRAALTEIDLPKQVIGVLAEDLSRRAMTVTESTKIIHLGKDLGLADLRAYQWLEITASLDGKAALAIEVHAAGTRNGRVPSGKLEGKVIALDAKTGTMLFHNTKGRERLLTFAVPRDLVTWLLFERRPVDVLQGPQVLASKSATLYLAPDRTEVRRILTAAPLLRCQVSAVDLQSRRLIVHENGTPRTWELPADVQVLKGTRKVKVADLRADAPVDLVLSLDRSKIRAVVLANSQ